MKTTTIFFWLFAISLVGLITGAIFGIFDPLTTFFVLIPLLLITIMWRERYRALKSEIDLYELSLKSLNKKYEFISSENKRLYKECDELDAELRKVSELATQLKEKADKWDALKKYDRERKKLPEICNKKLETFLRRERVYKKFIANMMMQDTMHRLSCTDLTLRQSFNFSKTPEKFYFWDKLNDKYKNEK